MLIAKTSKRVKMQAQEQKQQQKRKQFLDKRRCNTRINIDVLDKLDQKK